MNAWIATMTLGDKPILMIVEFALGEIQTIPLTLIWIVIMFALELLKLMTAKYVMG